MKKIVSLLLSLILAVSMPAMTAFARPDWPSDTGVQSEAGIVMDVDSKTVLFGQNLHVQKAPASITKVLTALVVVENSSLDDTVTFSHDAVYNVEDGSGNKNAIEEGDQMTVRDCLYFMLLTSSNQAANALAEHVGGSREGFVEMMNEKAKELGCTESHFANPSGLNDDTQLTSVYDMALIGIAAYSNPTLLEIGSAKTYRLPATANNPEGVTVSMEHQLLDSSRENYYPYAVAGKTGYTSIAGQTLITYAVKEDRRLMAVTMKSTEFTHYTDTTALLEFGFQSFQNIKIAEHETAYTSGTDPVELGGQQYDPSDLSMDENAVITIPRDAAYEDAEKTVTADLPANHPAGAAALLEYTYNDRKVGSVYLISASKAAEEAAAESLEETAPESGKEEENTPQTETGGNEKEASGPKVSLKLNSGQILITAIVVLAAVFIGLLVFVLKRRRDEERRLMEERRARRRKRLEEIGCTQEEFDRMLEARSQRSQKQDEPKADEPKQGAE